ncbi:MAG: RNA polymerase sigma factor [Cellulomonas iranensis]|nr:RNA polymerase sigma factor [Cellulomonas iranensis]
MRRWAAGSVGPHAADDVVTDTFLVAWRRWEDLPDDDDHRRAWVFVVARHKAAHLRARGARDSALRARLAAAPWGELDDVADAVTTSAHARDVLSRLRPEDREVLLLVGVEGLSPADAAAVLGCSVTAMTTRLSRARRRLEDLMSRTETTDDVRSAP